MSDATGRFWLCPVCRKHVPSRADKCQCGFDRTTVKVAMREVGASRVSGRDELGPDDRSRAGVAPRQLFLPVRDN